MSFNFDGFINSLCAFEEEDDVLDFVKDVLKQLDIASAIYVYIPREHLYDKERIRLHSFNRPTHDPLIDAFRSILNLSEEIPFMTLRGYDQKTPFYGFKPPLDIPSVENWTEKKALYERFPGYDGLIIPMMALGNKEGYFALNIKEDRATPAFTRHMQMVFQALHQRFCELADEPPLDINFSPREVEVMMWMLMGRNQRSIAEAMNVSAHTINGYIRNIHLKLKVDNSVKAAVKIEKLNLLVPHYPGLKSPDKLV